MQDQVNHSPTIEAPETVTSFLAFVNANGPVISREWFYGLLKKKVLPCSKAGRKILVVRSEVLARMRELGEQ